MELYTSEKTASFDNPFASFLHQSFSLPDSLIYFILKKPANPEIYQKLIKSCKYFFVKNPMVVLPNLYYKDDKNFFIDEFQRNLSHVSKKIWITRGLFVKPKNAANNKIVSSVLPQIYSLGLQYICLVYQNISLNQLLLLAANVEYLFLYKCNVMHQDGTTFTLERIVKDFLEVKTLYYDCSPSFQSVTSKTFKELLKLPHFLTLESFVLFNAPEVFDTEIFFNYVKKNKYTLIYLIFNDTISDAYKLRVEAIVDEIIETVNHEYKTPWIDFPGLYAEKKRKMASIFYGH